MTDENTRLPSDSVVDKGPWTVGAEGKRIFLQSDDFTHDVRLYIDGDFRDIEQRKAYAESLRKALAAQPRDDVRELLAATKDICTVCPSCEHGFLVHGAVAREDLTAKGDEQPDTGGLAGELEALANFGGELGTFLMVPDMTQRILTALRTDRKAVLEEEVARQEAYERGWNDCTESMTEATHRDGLTEGFAQYQADLRALAEGAGK